MRKEEIDMENRNYLIKNGKLQYSGTLIPNSNLEFLIEFRVIMDLLKKKKYKIVFSRLEDSERKCFSLKVKKPLYGKKYSKDLGISLVQYIDSLEFVDSVTCTEEDDVITLYIYKKASQEEISLKETALVFDWNSNITIEPLLEIFIPSPLDRKK